MLIACRGACFGVGNGEGVDYGVPYEISGGDMSYCRWSSDNWKCDVYCYEDVSGGWTTHVAAKKRVGDIPTYSFAKDDSKEELDRFMREYKAHQEALDKTTLEPIGLPYDGETFNDPTLEDFKDRLTMLKDAGYNVPSWVFETIDEEIKEEASL